MLPFQHVSEIVEGAVVNKDHEKEFKSRAHRLSLQPWQNPDVKPFIQTVGLTRAFGNTRIVNAVDVSIYSGEFFSLLGASGCGKTTFLRMLAGLEKPTEGKIFLDGVDITEFPPYERPINMMFQSYALFPHMTVYNNVAFGLKQEGTAPEALKKRVREALALVKMLEFSERFPKELSGGQAQRVALARSIVKRPKVLLLDEPLTALDRNLREKTQFELVNIQEQLGITFVMVTHDQGEAMTMSTRIGVMLFGKIQQIATPGEIYEYPNCRYVAEFMGLSNVFSGVVVGENDECLLVDTPDFHQPIWVGYTSEAHVGSDVHVVVRPEKIMISKGEPGQNINIGRGVVKDIAYLGDVSLYYVQLPSGKMVVAQEANLVRLAERSMTWEDDVFVFWRAENACLLAS